nr:hypothetical protein [Tanacetum cinerariifolium]
MGDEHLDTILATESDELIKSSVENLVLIISESEGIPNNMCDVPFHDNSLPLDISKDQFKDFSDSNDDSTLIDDNSFSIDNIDESEGIPNNMCDVPFHDNSLPLDISKDQFKDFSYSNDDSTLIDDNSFSIDNIEYVEASSPDSELVSLEVVEIVIPEVRGIDEDILLTIKDDILCEKLLNINLLIAKIKALKDNPTPSSDFMTKSDFYEFADELAHIISPPEYDCFCFKNEPSTGDFTMDVVEDIFPTREPRVHMHNVLPTHPTL